jgi:hypothetical protein
MKPLPSEIPEPDINNMNGKMIELYNNYYIWNMGRAWLLVK